MNKIDKIKYFSGVKGEGIVFKGDIYEISMGQLNETQNTASFRTIPTNADLEKIICEYVEKTKNLQTKEIQDEINLKGLS